ncbi:MAG TPA: phosphate ABC transporter, permease protein PstA, partial [Stellaceae bacterium]|nr:phosphate ABC transporter, permease protein PstA [Stellaceae bacterium]
MSRTLQQRRRLLNLFTMGLSLTATAIGLAALFLILGTLLRRGLPVLGADFFLKNTPAPGSAGGMRNAILGSLWMTLVAILAGTPIGILTATYLAEFGRGSRLAT